MRPALVLALVLAASCATAPPTEAVRPSPSPLPTIAPSTTAPIRTASGTPAQLPIVAASAPASAPAVSAPAASAPPASAATTAPATITPAPTVAPTFAPTVAPTPAPTVAPTPAPQAGPVMWSDDAEGRWSPRGTAPACPAQPMLVMPTSLAKATSVLYPGQYRPEYKPHGGLRFDGAPNAIEVRAPADMYLYRGARYPVGSMPGVTDPNEIQYMFDLQMPCGVMIRIGHLRKLTSRFQAIADTFPLPTTPDSRTTGVAPALVTKGELIATEIGLAGNVFYDLGVFDLRAPNAASRNAAFAAKHFTEDGPRWLSLVGHAVCWLRDWIPASESAALNALPGTAPSFKTSDYCG